MDKPELPPRSAATTSSNVRDPPPSAAVRYRLPQQQQSSRQSISQSPRPPELSRRRSSILSYSSIEDATQSFHDDIINPRTSKGKTAGEENEVTHWHSTPLAFAILPALGGVFFTNGSTFVTDILLLGLAAIFMNWSIRLPWDWYYSAQALRRGVEPDYSTIVEEPEEDEVAVETASSAGSSPPTDRKDDSDSATPQHVSKRDEAAADLRIQELWALAATFLFPGLAAYLLHVIRAQLSRPSTSLVSDYNLSIFLLAAEIRPCRQLVRLLANRTLHLQRTVTGLEDPFASAIEEKNTLITLTSRITDLEARLSEHTVVPPTMTIAQKTDVSELSAEMKKRYEPRLDGLERAVRRYEKRSTTLAMLTEQRLLSLETRLQEALSLAAVAAHHSQGHSIVATVLETVSQMIALPMKAVWSVTIWPLLVLEDLYTKFRTVMLGPGPKVSGKRAGGGGSKYAGAGAGASMEEKPRAKSAMRKPVR